MVLELQGSITQMGIFQIPKKTYLAILVVSKKQWERVNSTTNPILSKTEPIIGLRSEFAEYNTTDIAVCNSLHYREGVRSGKRCSDGRDFVIRYLCSEDRLTLLF